MTGSTYSTLAIQLMGTGDNTTTWGNVTNVNLGTTLEEAIVGTIDVPFTTADVTLTLTNVNTTQSARNLRLNLTGTPASAFNLIIPLVAGSASAAFEKPYIINNTTGQTITVKHSTGTGIAVPTGKTMWVYANGTNVVDVVTHLTSLTLAAALPVASGGTGVTASTGTVAVVLSTSPQLVTPLLGTPTSGVLTNCTGLPLTTGITGTLAVANGGTGQTTYTDGQLLIGNTTGNTLTKATLTAGTGIAITNGTGTISIAATGGTGTVTSASVVSANGFAGTVATATTTPAITLTTSITGVLKGNGTAISAATAGTDYVAPSGALGTPSSGTLTNCTFPTLNQSTTGSAATLTTARTLTIGATGQTFNGSANVTWTLAQIGAAASGANGDITSLTAVTSIPTTTTINGVTVGYRSIPRSTTATTAAVGDVGKCIAVTAGLTIPNATFAAGDAVSIYNDSGSAVTITQGTSLTLRQAGTASTGNRTLAARGMATVWFNTASEAIISGAGIS